MDQHPRPPNPLLFKQILLELPKSLQRPLEVVRVLQSCPKSVQYVPGSEVILLSRIITELYHLFSGNTGQIQHTVMGSVFLAVFGIAALYKFPVLQVAPTTWGHVSVF